MPEILVYAAEGRTVEQKKALMKDLEPWSAVVLVAGDVRMLSHQRPALADNGDADAGLLRLQPEAAVPLLCGGDAESPTA